MPRSDKPISSGSLTDPIASARSQTWTSHASPEDADQFEPDGAAFVDPLTQESVEGVVNLMDPAEPVVTLGKLPSTVAPVFSAPMYEWISIRSIEGTTYTRIDERHEVTADDEVDAP